MANGLAWISSRSSFGVLTVLLKLIETYKGVVGRFLEVLGRGPERIALKQGARSWSYRDLDSAANGLAARLVAAGVRPGDAVGVEAVRAPRTVVALLAVLKVGAAYVPLGRENPPSRLAAIVEAAGLGVVVGRLPALSGLGLTELDADGESPDGDFTAVPSDDPEALAYVMFTSGSTGQPKGVLVPHRAILRLVVNQSYIRLGDDERILQASPVTFDAATLEIWGALLNGGALVFSEDETVTLRGLGEAIRREGITTLWVTAGLFHAMADERPADFAPLRQLLTGGDVVSPARARRVLEACPGLMLFNGYGPTENTTFTAVHPISLEDVASDRPIPIGRPIDGTQVHVLGPDLVPVPPGAEGELCASGSGLALGYLGAPDLSAGRFVSAPWDSNVKLYRSGDLVREDEQGLLHFRGRIDTQLKVRGFRIEPGEIEATLEAVAGVGQAVVVAVARADAADKLLVAYFTGSACPEDLSAHLTAQLPPHAVPDRIVRIDALPLNVNGKVDRRALAERAPPVPEAPTRPQPSARPTVPALEAALVEALGDVLGLPASMIDPDLNFFDLGASSLQLARVQDRLVTALGREVPLEAFFRHASPSALARALADGASGAARPVVAATALAASERPRVGSGGAIAIIGMAGRFPGAPDVASFWQALVEGRELISQFSAHELEIPAAADAVLARGVVADAADFDAAHFGIPPREAERIDPQHRVLLEVAQTALEEAGHDPERFDGRIGIFAGSSQNSYLLNNLLSAPGATRRFAAGYPVEDFATLFGNDKDFLVTRIAYKLNLRGPAVTVQSACSTSLLAVAQACESLRNGQSDMALAGGVSITFPSRRPYRYLPDGMASADGHCRTFDADASGTVFGDGAALVVLRRLEDALADGDHIAAVIRGHAINNDGARKAGYAAPSIAAQAEVIREAHRAAGVEAASIGYVEAHGTATPLGDPIEYAALNEAFGPSPAGPTCLVGTAKTNVGHLDIAAGVTGLIKTALSLRDCVIPELLHFDRPNPLLAVEGSALAPAARRVAWERGEAPRRAGVSAFGVGGTNVHMVLEEAPVRTAETPVSRTDRPRAFPVSASSSDALAAAVARLGDWAAANPGADPAAVAATLRHGRRAFGQRTVLVAGHMPDLAWTARDYSGRSVAAGRRSEVAFLFPGQGAQHPGMGRGLFEAESVFRSAMEDCAALLRPEVGFDLLGVINGEGAEAAEWLTDTAVAQPAIFSIGYALARQWQHWGITPTVMVGHSVGEIAAATLAGVIDLADALRLIALRGRLMSDLPRGVMISVRASEAELLPMLTGSGLDLAAVNGARLCVVAGSQAAAEAFVPRLEAAGLTSQRLHTSHAFHSHMMDDAVAPFRAEVARVRLHAPRIPILSTVTGDWLTELEATDADYWAQHMRRPVRFHAAMEVLRAEGRHIAVETGPGRTLATLAGQGQGGLPGVASLPHAQAETACAHRSMIEAFGLLWSHGLPVDWGRLDGVGASAPRAAGLPTYPFQRKRFWVEPAPLDAAVAPGGDSLPGEATESPATPEAPPVESVADQLREVLADLSGLDAARMEGGATFLELGFDSLLLTQATRSIADRFGVTVTLRELIDGYATIDALAAHVTATGRPRTAAPSSGAPQPAAEAPTSAPMTRIATEVDPLAPEQQAHIDALVARYTARTPGSKALTARYRPWHADPRTASGFNRLWKEIVYQIVTVRSKGSRLIDVDGNEYIDILNGFGPGFLGHSPDIVVDALHAQIDEGFEVGPQSLAAMEAAQLFCEVTGNERTSFVCTGSEAVYGAMRVARTCTGRDRIVMFARDYHGNFDEVLVRGVMGADGPRTMPLAPGIPRESVRNIVVLPYGTPESLDWIRTNADTLAAVIVEPVQSRRPEFRPGDFIREVRRITEQSGALFVFDEVVTGFRFGLRGAQGFYGVDADLVTYGKVVGGGLPVGVVAGKARYMDTFDGGQWSYGDDSFPSAPVTFFAGTFVRHPLAMASVRAMLRHLSAQPAFFWRAMDARGDRLAGTLDGWFRDNDMPFEFPNCGSLMYLRIGEDQKFGSLIGAHMRDRGVFFLEGFPSYVTAAHDEADIDHVIEAVKDSALEMRAAGMLTGRDPVAHDGPKVRAVPPRLSTPGGEAEIAARMLARPGPIEVPTTTAQREILAAIAVNPQVNPGYNESVTLTLPGSVDIGTLQAALAACVARHDALRATFPADGMRMIVVPEMRFRAAETDLSAMPEAERANRFAALVETEVATPFDLANGPVIRAHIARMPDEVRLVLTAHHVVCDGWSIARMLADIGAAQAAASGNVRPAWSASESIADYVRAETSWSRSDAAAESRAYWTRTLAGASEGLDLPTRAARPGTGLGTGARIDMDVSPDLAVRLRTLARSRGATFANLMLAAFALHMGRLAGTRDVVLGMPTSGQAAHALPGVVGHCVNLLPVRAVVDPDASFATLLGSVRSALLDALDHQKLTFGEIVGALRLPRMEGRVPLVPVLFNIDTGLDLGTLGFDPVATGLRTNPRTHEHFDLYVNVTDAPDRVTMEWSYRSDLFAPETIHHWIVQFEQLLDAVARAPEAPVSTHDLLGAAERRRLLIELQGRRAEYPREETLATLFAAVAVAQGDRPALIGEDGQETSYRALDAMATALAHRLLRAGVGQGDIVGICLDRSPRMVAAMLAALRLGAAWLALDPAHPAERLTLVLSDACPRAVVTSRAYAGKLGTDRQLLIDDLGPEEIAAAVPLAPVAVDPSGMAYLIYTSGSTGRPKGVMGTHRATVNRLHWMARAFPFVPGEVLCHKTALSFVDSVAEIFGPLLAGVPAVILGDGRLRDPADLLSALGRHRVTRLVLVPSLLRMIVEAGLDVRRAAPDLRLVVSSGERLSAPLARAFLGRADGVRLVNLYGSSEVAADVTCAVVTGEGDDVPIGAPIDNARLYVLGPDGRLLPEGETGELHVGGDAVAAGYFNLPDLTDARFLRDPFAGDTDARMFATGDLVRWLPDGQLAYEGRRDHQIKRLGHRIELGEIEAQLAALPAVEVAAAVLARAGGAGDQRLVAFVSPAGADPAQVRAALAARLPAYMLPDRIVALEQLPLTPSGKIDRVRLADWPLESVPVAASDEPETQTEAFLHEAWAKELGMARIGAEENFFELGGHSLMAVRIFARIRTTYGLDLPISTLYAAQSIRSLAARIDTLSAADAVSEVDAGPPDMAPWDTTVVVHPGPGGSALPLFLVGGIGGNVNNLHALGREIGLHRPLIGLQTRGILGHRMHDTVEAIAADHIAHMRRHHTEGPWLLAGYSGGAFTAFEIARQLVAAGETVAWVGVLDMFAPGFSVKKKVPFRTRLGYEWRAIAERGFSGLGPRLTSALRGRLLSNRVVQLGERFWPGAFLYRHLVQHWSQVARAYRPDPYAGSISLFATRGDGFADAMISAADPLFGWGRLVQGGIRLRSLDSGHLDMLKPPAVHDLAAAMAGDINDALVGSGRE